MMERSNRLSQSQREGEGGGGANMKVNNRSERRRQIFKAASIHGGGGAFEIEPELPLSTTSKTVTVAPITSRIRQKD